MTWRLAFLLSALTLSTTLSIQLLAQSVPVLQSPSDAPRSADPSKSQSGTSAMTAGSPDAAPRSPNVVRLTVKDAEALALKNNPAISVARLSALASKQVTREVSSNLWPQTYANLTAVDAENNSRITAGGLNNPSVYTRAAGGATVSQLLTDFGHTANLVASARLQAKADEQPVIVLNEDVLVAVDQAFYDALQTRVGLEVAELSVAWLPVVPE